jgi:heme/copper-type cytochrome/quinol oxidase subunit 2
VKTRALLRTITASVALVPLLLPSVAEACAACFGRSDSPMAKGMNMGIFTLLIFILSVLLAISVFFFYIIRRAAKMAASQNAQQPGADSSQAFPQPSQ